MKKTLGAALAAATLGTSLLVAGPALAESVTVIDPAGNAESDGLDITSLTLDNRDKKILATISYVEAVRTDLVVSIDPKKARGVRVISQYRPNGETHSFVLTRAFTDKRGQARLVKCKGLKVTWGDVEPQVIVKLPARCLHDGDYGAIRGAVLSEVPKGGDSDYAPGDGDSTPFVARGAGPVT